MADLLLYCDHSTVAVNIILYSSMYIKSSDSPLTEKLSYTSTTDGPWKGFNNCLYFTPIHNDVYIQVIRQLYKF